MISYMRVNDNKNGLEFFEFVVLISYVYFVDGCQGGGIGFFCVECKYLIVLSCFPGRVYIPITTGKIPEHMKCPECPRVMEAYISFKCCHIDGAMNGLHYIPTSLSASLYCY